MRRREGRENLLGWGMGRSLGEVVVVMIRRALRRTHIGQRTTAARSTERVLKRVVGGGGGSFRRRGVRVGHAAPEKREGDLVVAGRTSKERKHRFWVVGEGGRRCIVVVVVEAHGGSGGGGGFWESWFLGSFEGNWKFD